jgi:hypothetical protein
MEFYTRLPHAARAGDILRAGEDDSKKEG